MGLRILHFIRNARAKEPSRLGVVGRDFGQQDRILTRVRRGDAQEAKTSSWVPAALVWSARFFAGLFVLSVLLVAIYGVLPVPVTPLMVIRSMDSLSEGKSPLWKRDWVAIDDISPRLQAAVIAAEDARFMEHNGFDFEAIEKAVLHNKKSTRRIRGGSTISQQVAKNVFLWPSRSWVRKGIEVYFTALIELLWSKRRILEVYLNVVEFGDGVYGAEAASRHYFRKGAVKLGSRESALMAAVLPNPRRFLIAKPSGYIRFRQSMIQRRIPIVGVPNFR